MARTRRGDGVPDRPLDLEWGGNLERARLVPAIIRDDSLPDNHPDRETVAWLYAVPQVYDRFDGVENAGLVVTEVRSELVQAAVRGFEDPVLVQRLIVVIGWPASAATR